jgi:hypothetical protein
VHPHVLKMCASNLGRLLSIIFKKSLATSLVPHQWLTANVSPLFKKGSRPEASNYRPVSLTSVLCKILEKFIRNIIMTHMYENELLSEHQHGFVRNKSCTTNLLEALDYLTWNEWQRTPLDVVFLDFAKAFDTVPHSRLLVKLKGYGVCEQLVKWTEAFLAKRVQRLVRGDFVSDWVEVTSGVPQGSVYGPTLFIIPGMLSSLVKLYADDTKLLADVSSHEGKMSLLSDLDKISSWSKDWLVKLNASKCKVMHFGSRNNKYQYRLNERLLEETKTERDLGVCISNDLKWEHQCNKAAAKANRMLGVLQKTFISRDILLWKRLYLAYVRPLLEFAIPV